jgi:hypothetical protein
MDGSVHDRVIGAPGFGFIPLIRYCESHCGNAGREIVAMANSGLNIRENALQLREKRAGASLLCGLLSRNSPPGFADSQNFSAKVESSLE